MARVTAHNLSRPIGLVVVVHRSSRPTIDQDPCPCLHLFSSLSLSSLELSDTHSVSLKYESTSELPHISVRWLFLAASPLPTHLSFSHALSLPLPVCSQSSCGNSDLRVFADNFALGHQVFLLTNSLWEYTNVVMNHINGKSLHPTPFTLHPTPYTLHPTPYTLHPTPNTLNSKPQPPKPNP